MSASMAALPEVVYAAFAPLDPNLAESVWVRYIPSHGIYPGRVSSR